MLTDPNLVRCVNKTLGLTPDAEPTATQVASITKLECSAHEIADLSGLSTFSSLQELDLSSNNITDISPLSDLSNLTSLDLGINPLDDLRGPGEKPVLSFLNISNTQVGDLTDLKQAKDLKELLASSANISDVKPLAGHKELERLALRGNNISELSGIEGATELWDLDLSLRVPLWRLRRSVRCAGWPGALEIPMLVRLVWSTSTQVVPGVATEPSGDAKTVDARFRTGQVAVSSFAAHHHGLSHADQRRARRHQKRSVPGHHVDSERLAMGSTQVSAFPQCFAPRPISVRPSGEDAEVLEQPTVHVTVW